MGASARSSRVGLDSGRALAARDALIKVDRQLLTALNSFSEVLQSRLALMTAETAEATSTPAEKLMQVGTIVPPASR